MGIYKIRTEFGQHLRWLMGILAVIFIIGGAFMFSGMPGMHTGKSGTNDDVVATVSGMPITKGEMEATWNQTSEMLRDQGIRSTLQFAEARARVFQSLVESRITLITAKAMGVEINNKEVNAKRDDLVVQGLKRNRQAVLGKIDAKHEKIDPRDDSEYKAELVRGNSSIGDMENRIRESIPEAQLQLQLAQDGIRKAAKAKAGIISDQDIKDSYNVYSVREIIIPKTSMPSDQLKTQVDKIASQAKSSGDFVALAKKYSQDPSKGAIQSVSFGMVAPDVWEQLSGMKSGQVSNPIDTDQAVYIVKVEGVTPKLPAKFDKKTQDERRGMIENMREMQAYMIAQANVKKNLAIKVNDPELLGYWELSKLQDSMSNPAEMKKHLSLASKALTTAIGKDPNNTFATAMLALVLQQQGNNDKAESLLYQLLEGKDSRGEGADLRIMLGEMLMKSGKKDDASKQYAKAAEAAGVDVRSHAMLISKFREVGRPDLAANEEKWMSDYTAKKKLYDAQQAKSGQAPTPGQ